LLDLPASPTRRSTFFTVCPYHRPPRAVRTPRQFSASAIPSLVAIPLALMPRMIGSTSAAKRSAPARMASRREEGFLRFCASVGQGFRDVSVYTVTQTLRFASPREYVRLQMTATPVAGLVADMESAPRDVLVDAIAGDLSAALCGEGEEGLVSPQEAHVLLARK
jgi:hypothetical protein